MTEAEHNQHRVAMASHDLNSATQALFELAASKTTAPLLSQERNDIYEAYVRLGRLLSQCK